jgi:hypothetical protein
MEGCGRGGGTKSSKLEQRVLKGVKKGRKSLVLGRGGPFLERGKLRKKRVKKLPKKGQKRGGKNLKNPTKGLQGSD